MEPRWRRSTAAAAIQVWAIRAAVVGVPVAAWAILTSTGEWSPAIFSSPAELKALLGEWLIDGSLYPHMLQTLFEVVVGLTIGTALGTALALVLAPSPTLNAILNPYLVMGNAVPRVIIAPIFVLWLGFGASSKIAVVAAMVFFPNFFNVYRGLTSVSTDLIDRTRTLGASQGDLVRLVYLPSVAVWALASLQASVGFAFLAAIVAEYVGASRGIGYLIGVGAQIGSVTQIFAGIIAILMLVLPLNFLMSRLQERLERWRPLRT
jgi:NitT/TauT family transport system permease protein